MTHKKEILRWADCPDGTGIWIKSCIINKWELYHQTTWSSGEDAIYIVDDEWAELRKAFIDGKTIQYLNNNDYWQPLKTPEFTGKVKDYRIKPTTETRWQFAYYSSHFRSYILTEKYYATVEGMCADEGCDSRGTIVKLKESAKEFNT